MNKIENKVWDAYTKKAENYRLTDKRERWDYLFSKLTCDHYLLAQIDLEGKTVLNIGCAPHPIDELFFARKCKKWVAIDINPDVLNAAQEIVEEELSPRVASKIFFEQADARSLPYEEATFDVVLAFSTIEHLPHEGWKKAISEMSRVVKEGGFVIVTVPNKLNLLYWTWSKYVQKKGTAEFGYEICLSPFTLKKELRKNLLKPLKFSSNFIFSPQIWVRFLKIPFLSYFGFRMGYLCEKRI